MFDLRYHVASLTAVFLALVIGIVVGVGISDRGLIDTAKRSLLEQRVARLQSQLDQASKSSALSEREQKAAELYINETYPVLVRNRLHGKRVAVVFVGSVDGGIRSTIEQTLTDAGAEQVRLRAVTVPIDVRAVETKLAASPDTRSYRGRSNLENLGRELGGELVTGGDTPAWDALTDTLVEERVGGSKQPADAVILARTATPQRGPGGKLLLGLYQGLTATGVPAVGVETTSTTRSAVGVYSGAGLSSVDDLDKPMGQLALVLLLGRASPGQYGLKASADASLPPFPARG
jgi:Copper transport outer membrane protein, MctB